MDIRVLRNFIQIARDESLTKASKKLHISQPALSRQMKELEEELNVKLFNRTSYAIHLTREGVRLLQRAEDIVSMADQTLREFSENRILFPERSALGHPKANLSAYWANV